MKRKRIALFFLGGSISTWKDSGTGGVFSMEQKEELLQFLPDLEKDVDVEVYSHVISKKFFLDTTDWKKAHDFWKQKAAKFDGLVIAQETDSVLMGAAFFGLLHNKCKVPTIITSSPVAFGAKIGGRLAEKNIENAIGFAAGDIGETCVYAHPKLIRAVRGKRRNISDETPFYSGQIDDLGGMGEKGPFLHIHREKRNNNEIGFPLRLEEKKIVFLRIYPGYPGRCLDYLKSQKDLDALAIESLGYGALRPDLIEKLLLFSRSGIPVIVIAEHDAGDRKFFLDADDQPYSNHHLLLVKNMTTWTTLAKAHIAASNTNSMKAFYDFMKTPITREIVG